MRTVEIILDRETSEIFLTGEQEEQEEQEIKIGNNF